MKNLKNLLERLTNTLNKDALLKEKVSQVVKSYTKIELKSNQINLKNGVLEISANPVVNNEIMFKEELIKKELKLSRIIYK